MDEEKLYLLNRIGESGGKLSSAVFGQCGTVTHNVKLELKKCWWSKML
jgi:hypothetical protein